MLTGVVPQEVLSIIREQVKRIAGQGGGTLGLTFFASLALSLWSANAGVKAIFDALNIVYDEEEKRGFLKLNLQSLDLHAGSDRLPAAGPRRRSWSCRSCSDFLGLAGRTEWLLSPGRWPLLLAGSCSSCACLYRFGPSRDGRSGAGSRRRHRVAGILWLVVSMLFSWYVSNFGNYNETYGSLGAVIGFMTWIWLSTIVVLIGAEINAEMEHQTARDTTSGAPRPMGDRGAQMADEVGKAA